MGSIKVLWQRLSKHELKVAGQDRSARTGKLMESDTSDQGEKSPSVKRRRKRKKVSFADEQWYLEPDPVLPDSPDDGISTVSLNTSIPEKVLEINHRPYEEVDSSGLDQIDVAKDIIIAVMGVTGSGKSSFISLLSDEDIQIGHGQRACTQSAGCYYFMLGGTRIWLIDTPGFDDTSRSDTEVLKDISYYLASAYTKKVRLAGIIHLHRITDVRMQGSALRNLRLFNELCGANNLNSVILVTTHWTHGEGRSVPEEVGEARVQELKETKEFWGGMIELGSRVEKHDGTKTSALKIVRDLVGRDQRITLGIQTQLVDEHKSLLNTDVGQALVRELLEERKNSQARLAELKLDMERALQEKDKSWQQQILEDRTSLENKIQAGHEETKLLRIDLKRIISEKDVQLKMMEEKFQAERAEWLERLKAAGTVREATGSYPQEHLMSYMVDLATTKLDYSPKYLQGDDEERLAQKRAEEFERWEQRQLSELRARFGVPLRITVS